MPTIEILTGKGEGKTFEFDQKAVMGRHKSNKVPLPDPRISRKHSRISSEDGNYYVEDLESRNGTYVNGVEVNRQKLESGDQIEMGDTVVVFRTEDGQKQSASGGAASGTASKPDQGAGAGGASSPSTNKSAGGGAEREVSSQPVSSGGSSRAASGGGSTSWIVYLIGFVVLVVIFFLAYFATIKVLPIIFG